MRRTAVGGVAALSLVLAACGTRVSDDRFARRAGQVVVDDSGQPVTGVPTGPGATLGPGAISGPAATTGPSVGPGAGPIAGPTAGPTGGPTAGPGGQPNFASDVGVTATTITIGNIITKGGIFGPDQFTPSYYGAAAFFQDLNARGGVHGRTVIYRSCDDVGEEGRNQECARQLIERDRIFAMAGNNIFQYGGDAYVNSKGVPDIGGQPIGTSYYTYPHLFEIYGNNYPRDGKTGYKGKLYGGSEEYRFYRTKIGIKQAGVVYYDQADSTRGASNIIRGLKNEGIPVTEYRVSLALANFDQVVVDMRDKGIDGVWDAMDKAGNANLCQAMNSNNYVPKVKSSTISTWVQSVGADFDSPCREHIYVTSKSRPYHETSHPEIAKFRAAMKRYFPQREGKLHQWSVEGWASAMWLTDAIASCGAAVTRVCVERFMNRPVDYTGRGLLTAPRNFTPKNYDQEKTTHECISVAQWVGSGWVTRGFMDRDCYTTNYFSYSAQ